MYFPEILKWDLLKLEQYFLSQEKIVPNQEEKTKLFCTALLQTSAEKNAYMLTTHLKNCSGALQAVIKTSEVYFEQALRGMGMNSPC